MTRDQTIATITDRLMDYFHPQRIYLFGFAARGDEGPDSDLDFCIVLPRRRPPQLLQAFSACGLRGIGTIVDIVRRPASGLDARALHVFSKQPRRRPMRFPGSQATV
jgi:predicted nucleotidyltransferase